MTAAIIDGKAFASGLRGHVAQAVSELNSSFDYQPTLAVVLVGDDPASHVYVRNKIKFTRETGMQSVEHRCDANIAHKIGWDKSALTLIFSGCGCRSYSGI